MRAVLEKGHKSILYKDCKGVVRWASDLCNARDLKAAVAKIGSINNYLEDLLALYEATFNHRAFTGRCAPALVGPVPTRTKPFLPPICLAPPSPCPPPAGRGCPLGRRWPTARAVTLLRVDPTQSSERGTVRGLRWHNLPRERKGG